MPKEERAFECPFEAKSADKNGGPRGNVTMVASLLVGLAGLGTYLNIQLTNDRTANSKMRSIITKNIDQINSDIADIRHELQTHASANQHMVGLNLAQRERLNAAERMLDMLWEREYGERLPARKSGASSGSGDD